MEKIKAIHIKEENFDGCLIFLSEIINALSDNKITRATIERDPGGIVKIETYRSSEITTPSGTSTFCDNGPADTGQ